MRLVVTGQSYVLIFKAIQEYKPQETRLTSFNQDSNNNTNAIPCVNSVLIKWLQRLQFKMGQIEMQASNVTQFFIV